MEDTNVPSSRKQINVRLDGEGVELLDRLVETISGRLGTPQTQSTVIRMALALLELNQPAFPSPVTLPPAEPAPALKPRGRPRKAP